MPGCSGVQRPVSLRFVYRRAATQSSITMVQATSARLWRPQCWAL